MIEHPNSLLVHQSIQAVQRGDTETLRALWAEDLVWRVRGTSPWQGDIHGIDAIFDYLAEVGESGSGYDTSIEDVMISSARAAILCHIKAEVAGRTLDADYVLLCRIAHRRIQEIISLPLDPDRIGEFWAA
jgi:ketosteroid isomerase-like protein